MVHFYLGWYRKNTHTHTPLYNSQHTKSEKLYREKKSQSVEITPDVQGAETPHQETGAVVTTTTSLQGKLVNRPQTVPGYKMLSRCKRSRFTLAADPAGAPAGALEPLPACLGQRWG